MRVILVREPREREYHWLPPREWDSRGDVVLCGKQPSRRRPQAIYGVADAMPAGWFAAPHPEGMPISARQLCRECTQQMLALVEAGKVD
jgi:hypothetical protein